jgi:hypothetical protein
MPARSIGTYGFSLEFTSLIPPDAQKVLEEKRKSRKGASEVDQMVAAFGLTPMWGNVPSLLVADVREAGVETPLHWNDTDEIVPLIHNTAFFIKPQLPTGLAASYSMKGVNIRLGLPEKLGLTDEPSQSYWSQYAPWIDGYVPSHAEAVRQFRPLKGEAEMKFDVAAYVGVRPDNPLIDAICARFYLPRDRSKLRAAIDYSGGYYGGPAVLGDEDVLYEAATSYKGAERAMSAPAEVGMGAGALMRQRHEDNPAVKASDFDSSPFDELVMRLVWQDDYNRYAREVGAKQVDLDLVKRLRKQQEDYEADVWRQLGGKGPRQTNVDSLPGA